MSYAICVDDLKTIERILSLLEDTDLLGDTGGAVVHGSDEHLDIILDMQRRLLNAAQFIGTLVDAVGKKFNLYTTEQAKEMLVKIFPIFRAAENFSNSIIKAGLHGHVNTQLEIFNNEINDLFEITNDLSRYRVNVRENYNALFNSKA